MPDRRSSQLEDASAVERADGRIQAIAQGRADIASGRYLMPQNIDEWVEWLGTAYERPVPQSHLFGAHGGNGT